MQSWTNLELLLFFEALACDDGTIWLSIIDVRVERLGH